MDNDLDGPLLAHRSGKGCHPRATGARIVSAPPSGEEWLHEIKHDGFRVIARKSGKRLRFNEH